MPKTIRVQDPDAVIRLDLAQTVTEAWPDASITLRDSADQLRAALRNACPDCKPSVQSHCNPGDSG